MKLKMKNKKSIDSQKDKKIKVPKVKTRKKLHMSYNTRLILSIVLFLLFISMTIFFLLKILPTEEQVINYKESGNLDYKVYLKENDFYQTEYLDKDMIYVSSLIDYIDVDLEYDFDISENSNIYFVYSIIGNLTIMDESGNNVYFEHDYNLLSYRTDEIDNQDYYDLKQNIKIDYDYYNDIANKFKMEFGLDTTSNLRVYLTIRKVSNDDIPLDSGDSELYIDIPLSERSINMTIDYNNLNRTQNIIVKTEDVIDNATYVALTAVGIVGSIATLANTMNLIVLLFVRKKTPYDKYIKRILKEYDRLIAETSHCPNFSDYNLIEISSFDELLDVRDNLKVPIMYYIVAKHIKSYFYIIDNNNLYLVTIKAVDLESKKDEKNI